MALAPELDATDLVRSATVVAVAILAGPPPLAGLLTGLPTSRLKTVALAIFSPRIGNEELAATTALASGLRAAHRAHHFGDARPGRKRKRRTRRTPNRKKEEESYEEEREENPIQEDGFSNRQLSPTFIPPLTLKAGAQAELHLFAKGGHGFDLGDGRGESAALWKESFVAWLRDSGFMK